jgi:hypothetical protein
MSQLQLLREWIILFFTTNYIICVLVVGWMEVDVSVFSVSVCELYIYVEEQQQLTFHLILVSTK